MKTVKFKDLKENDIFTLNNVEYKRTPDRRVSCCKVMNAVRTDNDKDKIMVQPLTEVQVND